MNQKDHKLPQYKAVGGVAVRIWTNHLKRAVDTLKPYSHSVVEDCRGYFFNCSWNQVYDFIEFIANDPDLRNLTVNFSERCNHLFKREGSAYRFVGRTLAPIISEVEIQSIESAASQQDWFKPVGAHITTALKHLADRISPGYRNSIKESISAVEAMCQIITGDPKAR